MPTEKNPFDKAPELDEEEKLVEEIVNEPLPDESVAMMEDGSAVVDLMGNPAIMPEEGMPGGHYDNLVPTLDEERLQEIERLIDAGATEEEAEAIVGQVERGRDTEGQAINPFKHGTANRIDGRPNVSNPQYRQDVSTDMRDHRMYRKGHALLRQIPEYQNLSAEQIKRTPEAVKINKALRDMTQPAAVQDAQPQAQPEAPQARPRRRI